MTIPILRQMAQLQDRSQDELKAMWSEYFGEAPPAYRRGFLMCKSRSNNPSQKRPICLVAPD